MHGESTFRYGTTGRGPGHWGPALLTSTTVYVLLAVLVVVLGHRRVVAVAERLVPVTFVEKVAKPEPPPAPATVVPQAPAAAAPVVRPDQKRKVLDHPPPRKELLAPRTMPQVQPKEADPATDPGVASVGNGALADPAGLEGGVGKGGVVGGVVGGAIDLPEGAIAPKLAPGATVPAYPEEARASRKSGVVELKIVILADGSVSDVHVVAGDEPFVAAAVAAVRTWRYEPARLNGQAIAVYRLVRIPFKLTS